MKILIVSWSILPSKGGSSIIIENLAQNFKEDELVVLGAKRLFQNTVMARPASSPKFYYFLSELHVAGRGLRYFDWYRNLRFQSLINAIKSVIEKEKIEYVIGVFPNAYYCHAACIAAEKMKLPFSSYFHNTFTENVAIKDPKTAILQKKIFDQSEYIFVMSHGMKRFYEQKYPGYKFRSLLHTFNEFPTTDDYGNLPGENKGNYKLVAIGNFNESNMDATLRFAATIHNHPKYSLSLFTHVPKVLLRQRGLNTDSISYEGFVDPNEVHQVLQNFDICVLTHGFTGGYGEIEYKTIFPTRTIPLLLSGKPIIVHSPKGSFLNEFIREHKCAELVEEPEGSAIINALDKITNNLEYQKELIAASEKTVRQFYGPAVVESWKAELFEKHMAGE